jgi:hypothetical protein
MQFATLWRLKPRRVPAPQGLARLKQIVEAARNTAYYRPLLESAGLSSPASLAKFAAAADLLKELPYTSEADYFTSPERFHNPAGRKPSKQTFRYPFDPMPKTALLSEAFRGSSNVKVFAGKDCEKAMAAWGPDAIAAPLGVLRSLAIRVEEAEIPLGPVRCALVALAGPLHGYVTDDDRELCWRVFQVPIFEQLLGYRGESLAHECEAHEGFHVDADNAMIETVPGSGALTITPLSATDYPLLRVTAKAYAQLDASPCGCGKPGLRIAELETSPIAEYCSPASAGN